jgi:hypothetical protein
VCMVATGLLVLCVATFAKSAKNTIYSNSGAYSSAGPKIRAQIGVTHGNWPSVMCYTS